MAITYKINPFKLSNVELKALDLCREYAQAIEEVHLREVDSELSPERMYDLTLTLTGDEEQAQLKRSERWLVLTR